MNSMTPFLILLALFFTLSEVSFSALGDRDNGTPSNQAEKEIKDGYSIYRYRMGSGKVTEYGRNGVIVAVKWVGHSRPDYSALLGKYFREYQAKVDSLPRSKLRDRHHSLIQTENLTLIGNRKRALLSIRAYVPSLLPSNFDFHSLP